MAKKQAKASTKHVSKEQELNQLAEKIGEKYTQELKRIARTIAKNEPGMSSEHYMVRAEFQFMYYLHRQLMRSEEEFPAWIKSNK